MSESGPQKIKVEVVFNKQFKCGVSRSSFSKLPFLLTILITFRFDYVLKLSRWRMAIPGRALQLRFTPTS